MHVTALISLAAPFVFVILVVSQGLQYSDYSHSTMPISALAAWPLGWVQNLNFVVLGSGMFAFAVTLHRSIMRNGADLAGPLLLVTCGIGLVLAAAFPWTRLDGSFIVPRAHLAGAALTFLGAGAGFIVISRRMRTDPHWRGVATYTLTNGVAVLVLFGVTMAFARTESGPLHPWLGLLQRLAVLVWLQCMVVASWRAARASTADVYDNEGTR